MRVSSLDGDSIGNTAYRGARCGTQNTPAAPYVCSGDAGLVFAGVGSAATGTCSEGSRRAPDSFVEIETA